MDDLQQLLLWIAMPAAGSLVGGLLAEAMEISGRMLTYVLHGVTGILVGVVGIELMPAALGAERPWLMVLLFGAGGLFMLGVDRLTNFAREVFGQEEDEARERAKPSRDHEEQSRPNGSSGESEADDEPVSRGGRGAASAWVIFIGVALDFLTDGLLLVSGSGVASGLGLLLGLALLAADTPEAFSTIATLKRSGASRAVRLWITASFPLLLIGGALAGHWILRGQPEAVSLGVMAFTAGIILTLVESEVIPKSMGKGEGQLATMLFLGGFMMFALLSAYLA